MFLNALLVPLILTHSQPESGLVGHFEVIASVTNSGVELESPKSTWQFVFDKNGDLTWINTDPKYSGIPLSGTKMSISFDTKSSPKRFEIWFREGDQNDPKTSFAYGIYTHIEGNLLMKLLMPLGVASNGSPEDIERFRKSPYPLDFTPPEAKKFEILYVLKRIEKTTINPKR